MIVKRRISSPMIPGAETHGLSFVIRWASGKASASFVGGFSNLIRLFEDRLRLVPITERDSVTAHVDVTVRKAGGGVKRVMLAKWAAVQPLPEFYNRARIAYRQIPIQEGDRYASFEVRN